MTNHPNRLSRLVCFWLLLLLPLAGVSAVASAEPLPATEVQQVPPGGEDNLPTQETPPPAPPKPAYLAEDQPLQLKEYEEPTPATQGPLWQQALGLLFKLVLVLALAIGSMFAVKKFNGGRLIGALPQSKGRNMVVLETTHLSPQQAIHLISLGGERLLVVGAGPQGVTTLAEITEPAQMRPFLHGHKEQSSPFNQVFDMETVSQDEHASLYEAYREARHRQEWPR